METLTLDMLRETQRRMEEIPPAPLLVSSKLLPSENAITFKHERRDYVGAHPDFWAKLPPAPTDFTSNPWTRLTIHDIDSPLERHRKAEFYEAMGKLMAEHEPKPWRSMFRYNGAA